MGDLLSFLVGLWSLMAPFVTPFVSDLRFLWLEPVVAVGVVKRGSELAVASWLSVMRIEMKESRGYFTPTMDEVR